MRHALPMAAYQVLEELSEKLSGPSAAALVAASNRATVQCLAGEKYRAADLLKEAESLASSTSLFQASRDARRFQTVAELYVLETGRGSVEAIDGGLWPLLVTKAESCRLAASSVRHRWLGPMVTQGLMDRFRRGAMLAADGSAPASRRLMAVLTFYVATIEPLLRFETLAELPSEGAFAEAVSVAAMMVRLLKEVGTPLLTNDWVRGQFSRVLDRKTAGQSAGDLGSVLYAEAENFATWLARIVPDVKRPEGNVCLHGLRELPLQVSIPRFCDRLDYLAGMFANSRRYLDRLCRDVTLQLASEVPAKLIMRFVEFHERIYAGPVSGTTQVHRAVS